MKLEDLKPGARVKGLPGEGVAQVKSVQWFGDGCVDVLYLDGANHPRQSIVYRDDEATLELASEGQLWSFDADGGLLRLVSEAYRIRLAHLFDPYLAVQTSQVTPLPHQITAVYGEMLPQETLRYLLADDPGAGKTIMAGLFIKELILRGDVRRCAIVCPGNLAEQWQDELWMKFNLPFEILTNDKLETSRTGNWFEENKLVICRLDKLSRDDETQEKLLVPDWDLVVVDEAHKMSATYYGSEVKYTKRYRLGQNIGGRTRHLLLMTATPHNGKEQDFQLFMALLDADRFEGKFKDGHHSADTAGLMRRMIKEKLVTFEGTPLFPERRAYTVDYKLSSGEAKLYADVTRYVENEFNRADALENEGRKGTVGFALTTLQRRLASSPEAIYRSLQRRRERLEDRLREEKLIKRGSEAKIDVDPSLTKIDPEAMEELDDAPGSEVEAIEEAVIDRATAAQTIRELELEIDELKRLEALAKEVRRSGSDRKWDELSRLLQESSEMFDAGGHRRKLVLFTEHRDTLNYLLERIGTLLGRKEAIVTIHGGMGREERRKSEKAFTQDKEVQVLVATDAAGEGINLQRAHLMVNYDLPWNPNRLEQRFGRIHRIGQTEVCHLWNLVAGETREGQVLAVICKKLEEESKALNGQIFDVIGKAFGDTSLRDLLLEAIRYGNRPEVREHLTKRIGEALDHSRLLDLVEDHALTQTTLDALAIRRIREEMDRAEARKLQPYFISSFFLSAFRHLGGTIQEREPRRFEITHVPAAIRHRDRLIGMREPVLSRYERVTFEKDQVNVTGKPMAELITPGHPLLDATIDLILERHHSVMKTGAVLIDPSDSSAEIRVLVTIEHAIQDGRSNPDGTLRHASRELQFVEILPDGSARRAGYAPYLDYEPASEEERQALAGRLASVLASSDIESLAVAHALKHIVPDHLRRIRKNRDERLRRTAAAVKDRLTIEIAHWDRRAQDLKAQEQAGKQPRMNWQNAQRRADDLQGRLQKRLKELEDERRLNPLPPIVISGALVVPRGLVDQVMGRTSTPALHAKETAEVERIGMEAVMAAERALGFEPRDVSAEKCGWDVESRSTNGGPLRFIEVKGRVAGASTVTVTKNEILAGLNKPQTFILAIVEVDNGSSKVRYVRTPFSKEPDFGVTSVNYDLKELLSRAEDPR
ncbi:MAG: DUF3883 domain-containing protein [Thermoanaerobaculia bacterium]|nr:DUF3883 domain-containing protein [Thermoanaerobaculia bacterium]